MYERTWYVGNDLLLLGESLTLKGHKFSARSDPRDYTSEVKPFKNKKINKPVGQIVDCCTTGWSPSNSSVGFATIELMATIICARSGMSSWRGRGYSIRAS